MKIARKFSILSMVFVRWAIVLGGTPTAGDTGTPIDSSNQIAARIINSRIPVIVDFWAPWCKPCLLVSPVLDQIAREYKGRTLLIKVNIDVHRKISEYFSVVSIPAVHIVYDKVVRASLQGVRSKEEYQKALDAVLALRDARRDSSGVKGVITRSGGADKDTSTSVEEKK